MKQPFYITTTLPYVNSDPHIGFAMEIVRADVVARIKELEGFEVFFNTGTDEHGQKIFDKAKDAKKDTKEYVDGYAEKFKDLKKVLGLKDDLHFIRTTDEKHIHAAQEFWNLCFQGGDIYKKNYKVKYCVGCELEKQDSEIVNGKCELHPNMELEIREEENYFFKFSRFQKLLLEYYKKKQDFVVPDFRFNEIKSFVERGLEDFSISRLKSKMAWGVSVPNDPDHVMYVWFDALVSYISTLGWPEDKANFEKYWKQGSPVQYCGKDNLRQQSAMWQAMLMSAGLQNSKHIVINGFITGEGGLKMSKSLGNATSPNELVLEYGTDALRYFLLSELSNFEDSPFTVDRFKASYNSGLANGLGNLVSRIMTLSEKYEDQKIVSLIVKDVEDKNLNKDIIEASNNFDLNKVCQIIWEKIGKLDKQISDEEVFKLVKTDMSSAKKKLTDYLDKLATIAIELAPVLPETSQKIIKIMKENKKPGEPLFLRK
jgi:methionyl-tRNA synthetase